jgi:hypothetical protein
MNETVSPIHRKAKSRTRSGRRMPIRSTRPLTRPTGRAYGPRRPSRVSRTFVVEDDGIGFDPATTSGSGLNNMRDRLEALGGELAVGWDADHGYRDRPFTQRFGGTPGEEGPARGFLVPSLLG